MAMQRGKPIIPICQNTDNDEEAQNLNTDENLKSGKRRSSILKPARCSPKSPRNPLGDFNREEIKQEKRKSLANKRVSFADTHQITEFLADYNACSKEFDGTQDYTVAQLSTQAQTLVHYQVASSDKIFDTEDLENQIISHSGTNFFTDSSANMHDTTYFGEDFLGVEDQPSIQQHNITDNASEDMSLTFDILSKNVKGIELFGNGKSVSKESFFRKAETCETEIQALPLLFPNQPLLSEILTVNDCTVPDKCHSHIEQAVRYTAAVDMHLHKSNNNSNVKFMEISNTDKENVIPVHSNVLETNTIVCNDTMEITDVQLPIPVFENHIDPQLAPLEVSNVCINTDTSFSHIEQFIGNTTIGDMHINKSNEVSYFLDSALKFHMTTEMSVVDKENVVPNRENISEPKTVFCNDSMQITDVIQECMIPGTTSVPQENGILNFVSHQDCKKEIPLATLSDSTHIVPFANTFLPNESMNTLPIQTPLRIKKFAEITHYTCPMELTNVEGEILSDTPHTAYGFSMEISSIKKDAKEILLDHLTLSAIYSPKDVLKQRKENIPATVDLLDHADNQIFPDFTMQSFCCDSFNVEGPQSKLAEDRETPVLNSDCMQTVVKEAPNFISESIQPSSWNNIVSVKSEEQRDTMPNSIQAKSDYDLKADCKVIRNTGARPKTKSNSGKPQGGFTFIKKIQAPPTTATQCKVNLNLPQIVVVPEPQTVDQHLEVVKEHNLISPVVVKELPVGKQASLEKPKSNNSPVQNLVCKSTFLRTNPLNRLKNANLLKSPSRIPIKLISPKNALPKSSSVKSPRSPLVTASVITKPELTPTERSAKRGKENEHKLSDFKPSKIVVFTTPSQRRSVVVHRCSLSHEKRTPLARKHTCTPASERSKPALKKLCNKKLQLNSNNPVDVNCNSLPLKSSTSGKHSITPVSERIKPAAKKIFVEKTPNLMTSCSLNTEISLIKGFSLDEHDNQPLGSQPAHLKSQCVNKERSPCFIHVEAIAPHSQKQSTIQKKSLVSQVKKPSDILSNKKLNDHCSQPISSKSLAQPSPTNLATSNTSAHHDDMRLCASLRSDNISNVTGKSIMPEPMISSQNIAYDQLVPQELDFFGSPALSSRCKKSENGNLNLEITEITSQIKSLAVHPLNFQDKRILDTTASDNSDESLRICKKDEEVIQNFTFTAPTKMKFCKSLELQDEVEAILTAEGLQEWTFKIQRRNKKLVHFTYLNKHFYLVVQFGKVLSDGNYYQRAISNLEIKTRFSDDLVPNNIWVMKIMNHHLKYATPLENFKTSKDLSELLENLTDTFFRGHCLMNDLQSIGLLHTNMILDIKENEQGFDLKLKVFNSVLLTEFHLIFPVKYQSYPFAAIRPTFQYIQGIKTETFKVSAMRAIMLEKTGEKYLTRMWDAARRWLDDQVTQADIDRQNRIINFVFVI